MGRVVHFEITADDMDRAKKFYQIFGWKLEDAGMGMEYLLARTGEGMGIDGAIMPRSYKPQPVIPWISVDDVDAMADKVKAAGGSLIGEKQTVPTVGDTLYCKDTEGNIIGMIQPLPRP